MKTKFIYKTAGALIIMTSLLIFSSYNEEESINLAKVEKEQPDNDTELFPMGEKNLTKNITKINLNNETTVGNEKWIEKTINKELMKTDSDCGIASVKMLLGFYGIDISYEELGSEINTTVDGTNWEDIKKYLGTLDNVKSLEFEYNLDKAKEYSEKGIPLLINWNVDEEDVNSHYSILIAIDKNSVWMLDPEEKKSLSEYSLDYFLPCWESENYWFCVLEERDKKITKQEQIVDGNAIINLNAPERQAASTGSVDNLVWGILTLMH
jgi:ABC-type bacteriocin/lantibiotic exporter with double-glycine peptidase domain